MNKNIGKVIQIIGPVLDIKFENGHLPNLLNAIEIEHEGKTVVCEVASQLGDDVVRCIARSGTDGMSRGMDAVDTGTGITVPVGKATLGRIFNLLGEAIDNMPDPVAEDKWFSALEGTRWLDYTRSCLRKASDISVLVTSRVRSVVLQGEFLGPTHSIPCPFSLLPPRFFC